MAKRLALTVDGNITYCTATDENIGKGRCNHVSHQKNGQSIEDYIKSVQKDIEANSFKKLSLKEVKLMYENGENIDELKKINKKTVVDYLVSQGETDFPELSKSNKQWVKEELAKGGLYLDKYLNDEDDSIRYRVAERGYGLDKLVNDKSPSIRSEVARHRYGLDKLINDENSYVRSIVAEQGYGLDKLVNDESENVRLKVLYQG